MHIVENKSKIGKKIYSSTLLRESFREDGKVKKRTIANLSSCSKEEIEAMKLALQHKDDLSTLVSLRKDVTLQQGKSFGALWVLKTLADQIGLTEALGNDEQGKLAMWQVFARLLHQGSRLSAVREAQHHSLGEILNFSQGFDEDDLYKNLQWLSENQEQIEQSLFTHNNNGEKTDLFLYDVTSSYLEGTQNHFGAFGYNRDGKRGKRQIVLGLLCDKLGEPISIKVYTGNTQDVSTFNDQVQKLSERFGCSNVTMVGDRGMIKTTAIEHLPQGFHYITAITKPQIQSLLKQGVFNLGLFDEKLAEIHDQGIRYILRRNPVRVDELAYSRQDKQRSVEKSLQKKNDYLRQHPRASLEIAQKEIENKIQRLHLDAWLKVATAQEQLILVKDELALQKITELDGCYVLKTDLKANHLDAKSIHDRYKDLALVEKAFRNMKTVQLEMRPIYVQTEHSTKGHALIVMLAYKLARVLEKYWQDLNCTIQEGLSLLTRICGVTLLVQGKAICQKIPIAANLTKDLLDKLNITLPEAFPVKELNIVTKKKLLKLK